MFAKAGRAPKAVERWQSAIEKRSESSYARSNLVRMLIRQKKLDEAAKLLDATPKECSRQKAILAATAELSKAMRKD